MLESISCSVEIFVVARLTLTLTDQASTTTGKIQTIRVAERRAESEAWDGLMGD